MSSEAKVDANAFTCASDKADNTQDPMNTNQLQPGEGRNQHLMDLPVHEHAPQRGLRLCCAFAFIGFVSLALVFSAVLLKSIHVTVGIDVGNGGCVGGKCHPSPQPETVPAEGHSYNGSTCPTASIVEHFSSGSTSAFTRWALVELKPPLHTQPHGECTIDGGGYAMSLWSCEVVCSLSHCTAEVGPATVLGQHHVRVTITTGTSCPGVLVVIPIQSEYLGECFNRIQDIEETGIDCGGDCSQCEVDINVSYTTGYSILQGVHIF